MTLPQYPTDRHYVYQTDPEFLIIPAMKPNGCYFMSWVEALTAIFKLPFTHESVINFYDLELVDADKDVDNEMFVGDPQDLIDDLVGPRKVKFLGKFDTTHVCADDEIEIGCWHKTGNSYNHFTHCNGRGITLYDPWGPNGSDSVSEGNLIGKRIARLLSL